MRISELSAQTGVAGVLSELFGWSRMLVCIAGVWPTGAAAQSITQLCQPAVSNQKTVVTAAQRKAAGNEAIPPITDSSVRLRVAGLGIWRVHDECGLHVFCQRRRASQRQQ